VEFDWAAAPADKRMKVSVKPGAEVIGLRWPPRLNVPVMCTVTNTSTAELNFTVMSPGVDANWKTDNPNLAVCIIRCFKNGPAAVSLKPGQSWRCGIEVQLMREVKDERIRFRLGFRPEEATTVNWSNEVVLKIFGYRLPADRKKRYDELIALREQKHVPQCVDAVRELLTELVADPKEEEGLDRIVAIKVLAKYRDRKAIPVLLKALDDPFSEPMLLGSPKHTSRHWNSVAGEAAEALFKLTSGKIGERFRPDRGIGPRDRFSKKVARWRQWWLEHLRKTAPRAWRVNRRDFAAHLGKVENGWSKQQLKAHAGEPDEKTADSWSYQWEESRISGGHFFVYAFHFKDGLVSDIKKGGGHVTKKPRKEVE